MVKFEEQREKRNKKNEQSLREMWALENRPMYAQRKYQKERRNIFKEIMSEIDKN